MIDLALTLPLADFPLRVQAVLAEGVTAIMGPSGAGKTSLLEAVAGLRRHAAGRIVVDGTVFMDTAARTWLPPQRRRVGYVPQDAALFPHLTTLGNVRFGARRGDAGAVRSAIETLELGSLLARYPATLSGGEKRRVALARALATGARLLLLDEPLAALDVGLRARILPYLLRIRAEWRIPMLYVTHSVGEALAAADTLLVVRDGAVEAQGSPAELLGSATVLRETESIENLRPGRVAAHDDVGCVTRVALEAGPTLSIPLVPRLAVDAAVTLAVRAEDIVVATGGGQRLSARNVLAARVLRVQRAGADVILHCGVADERRPWFVRLTPAALADLRLVEGSALSLAIKSHSIRIL